MCIIKNINLKKKQTKVTSRNAFIDNLFALESEKESKNDERIFFRDYPWISDLSVNPSIATYMWFSGQF